MRAVIQCVRQAKVTVDNEIIGQIGPGYLIFLGVGQEDTEEEVEKLWSKIFKLRILPDENGKTNLSLSQIGGNALIISQFTLFADCRKGNRPNFLSAASPEKGEDLYEKFLTRARKDLPDLAHGSFGANMDVELVNQGPFTLFLDTDHLQR